MRDFKENINNQEVIILTKKCNQNCIFCSGSERRKMSTQEIKKKIFLARRAVIFEGGEPTMSVDLLNWVKIAKDRGIKELVLVTNGVMLSSRKLTEKLIKSGVTLFNISFHSHRKLLYGEITQSAYYFLVLKGIKNLIELGAASKIRFTFVISKKNYKILPSYMNWLKKEFPGIFYVAINYVKVLGKVRGAPRNYVPKFKEVRPYLLRALKIAKQNDLKVLTDGFPLCLMDEFPECNEDVQMRRVTEDFSFMEEKTKTEKCKNCLLDYICGWIIIDYRSLDGDK